jgi:molybdopterin molybdotransferase
MWFGVRTPDKAVYALPGNPVSTLVSCVRYVIPGLYAAMGAEPTVPAPVVLESAVDVPGLAIFLPVKVTTDAAGRRVASPRPTKGSGDFIALKGTDGFVELPAGPRTAPAGSLADFHPW